MWSFMLLLFVPSAVAQQTECSPTVYREITDVYRSTAYRVEYPVTPLCDDMLPSAWYRFNSTVGNRMPEHCIARQQCGTIVPIWLNGTHPSVAEGRVMRKACGNFQSGYLNSIPCCEQAVDVVIRNCGTYFVYYLQPTPSCPIAYCIDSSIVPCLPGKWSPTGLPPCKDSSIVPCLPGKWSPTGLPPCKEAYPTMTTPPVLRGPEIINAEFQFSCEVEFPQQDPEQAFEIAWTFNDIEDNSTLNRSVIQDPHRIVYLPGYKLRGHLGNNVGCKVRSFYRGNEVHPGPWLRSNVYWAGVRAEPVNMVISESDERHNVTVVSTIPILCNFPFDCCLRIKLAFSGRRKDAAIPHNCVYLLCSDHWNPSLRQAAVEVPMIASRDQIPDSDNNLMLVFQKLISNNGGPYSDAFVDFQINPVHVIVRDRQTGFCSIDNDPHVRNFADRSFYFYQYGDYTVFQNPSRNFQVQIRTGPCGGTCVCGVAIQEKNDVIKIDACDAFAFQNFYAVPVISIPWPLRLGTEVFQSPDGREIVVYLPSSAEVKVTLIVDPRHYQTFNVYLTIPSIDFGFGRGLCGTFDNIANNDYTHRSGYVDSYASSAFIDSWKNSHDTSLFRTLPRNITDPDSGITYCQCDNSTALVNCTARGYITGKKLTLSSNRNFPPSLTPNVGGWAPTSAGKRALEGPMIDEDIDDNTLHYDPDDYQHLNQEVPTWPTKSNITENMAEEACLNATGKSVLWPRLQESNPEKARQFLEDCKLDILYSDSFFFLKSLMESITTNTQIELAKDPNNYVSSPDGETVLKPEISSDLCSIDCLQNGHCERGICVCNPGYMGDTCQLQAGIGPQLGRVGSSGVCDIVLRPCQKIFIEASNFEMSDTLACKVLEILPDGSISSTSAITTAIFVTERKLACNLPDARVKTERSVKTFAISVTNDGMLYGNEVRVTVFDSSCQSCNGSNCVQLPNTCQINNLCYQSGDLNPNDNNQICNTDLSTSLWSQVPTVSHDYPHFIGPTLSGPTHEGTMVCAFNTSDTSPTARFKISWYIDGTPHPVPRELNISPGELQAVYSLTDLPRTGMLVCKIRSLYNDRNILSPYQSSNAVDLSIANSATPI